jgi:hypothetical protein
MPSGVHFTSLPSTSPVTRGRHRRGRVEVILERLLVEVLAIAVQLALWRLLEWVGSGTRAKHVASSTTV